jgi:hypothetical protein
MEKTTMKIYRKAKLALVIAVSAAFLYSGCGDDSIISSGGPASTVVVSGTIDNWPADTLIVKAIVSLLQVTAEIGIDTVTPSGQLSMTVLTPPQNVLDNVTAFFGDTTGAITFSDNTALVTSLEALGVFADSIRVGDVDRRNYGADSNYAPGSFTVDYIYSSRPVNITGTVNRVAGSDTNRITYNLSLNSGWNFYILTLNERRTNFTASTIATATEPAGARWYFTIANP